MRSLLCHSHSLRIEILWELLGTFIDLCTRPVSLVAVLDLSQVGPNEISTGKTRAIKVGSFQIGAP